jgi:hypothetical protein
VKEITIARHQKAQSTTITIGKKDDGMWAALNDPSLLGAEGQQEAYDWQRALEEDFVAGHREARPEFQKVFAGMDIPNTFGKFLRSCVDNPAGYSDSVAVFYADCTGSSPTTNEVQSILADVPEWRLYLGGWAQGMYAQGIQPQNFSPKKNAGTVDLWCAVYLQHCDFFITDDGPQRRALRVLNVLSSRKPRAKVLSYDQFRSRFILSPMK